VRLIGELAKRKDCSQVFIEKNDFTLRLEKKQEPERRRLTTKVT